jgi:hypothetical protein
VRLETGKLAWVMEGARDWPFLDDLDGAVVLLTRGRSSPGSCGNIRAIATETFSQATETFSALT